MSLVPNSINSVLELKINSSSYTLEYSLCIVRINLSLSLILELYLFIFQWINSGGGAGWEASRN